MTWFRLCLAPLLVLLPAAAPLGLHYRAAQDGARSGITNTVFTAWMPPGMGFAGLSGGVGFGGNTPGFAEGLITLGTTLDDRAACAARNGTWPAAAPPVARLWSAILKSNSGEVGVRADVTLPFPVPPPGRQGACLMTLISAGYPYLDARTARYVTTSVSLQASLLPVAEDASVVLPLGLGGEFSFATGAERTLTTYVGIKALHSMAVDAVAGSVSASAVVGAPAGSRWLPLPTSFWSLATDFVFMPAPVCASAGFVSQPSNGTYAVMRRAKAAPFAMPAGSRIVMRLPVSSTGTAAVQNVGFQAANVMLDPGDCLVALHSMLSTLAETHGMIDDENQSTVYLRVLH